MNPRISDIRREMTPQSIIWLICSSFLAVSILADEDVLLEIPQGTLKGIKSTTVPNNKPLYSFIGIPYAKAIDASNKFKVAEPPETWSGVYDATEPGSECVCFCITRQKIVGDDNCLFVNVFTPELNKDARKAVMIWIHGGGFNTDSGDPGVYGPDFLVEQDVVLVSFNYRLGAFGFLGTEDSASPGNVGLKDQTAALKWVQDNIQYFGGCPRRVTIFGQSAGGASVQYHMMSPMSAGLFAHAISQSGSAVASGTFTQHPKDTALKLAEALGIQTTDSAELVKELTQIPSYDIVKAAIAVDKTELVKNHRWYAFLPCIEPDVDQEIFLPADPWELVKTGKLADVPYIAGLNLNETSYLVEVLIKIANVTNENFEKLVPHDLNFNDPAQRMEIADSIRKFYFGDSPITKDLFQEYAEMTMDVAFSYSTQIPLTIINSLKSTPTFNYLYTYDSPFRFFELLNASSDIHGALHSDELRYMFFPRSKSSKPVPGSEDDKVTHLITKLWTNFAKTGNPTSTLDDVVTVNWEPMGDENNYAIINERLTMGRNMLKERIDFWVSIYKDIIGDYANLF